MKPNDHATHWVEQINPNNELSAEQLLPLVYGELRKLASRRLANDGERSLQTTELVHEAYLRLAGSSVDWQGRSHYFAAAAEAMRRILVDRARRRKRRKHGGGHKRVDLCDSAGAENCNSDELLAVDDLFDRLTEIHPEEAEVAKLRYFVGFNHREVSEILEIPLSTAHSRWAFAKAWLYREYCKADSVVDA